MKMNRRSFLGLAGGAAATLAGCRPGSPVHVPENAFDDRWRSRTQKLVASVCLECPGRCGLRARVVDGAVVGIRGNPFNPVNREGLCPRALALPQLLCSPDRITRPLRAAGRGSGEWHEISWEAALREIGEKLGTLRVGSEPQALLILTGTGEDVSDILWRRFARAFGTPNLVRCGPPAASRAPAAVRFAQGIDLPVAYDVARAGIVLSFGCDLAGGWRSPVSQQRALGLLRRGQATRGRYVHVGHTASTSAAKADRRVPVRPGTEAAFALGLANVLIREHLYDKAFVNEHVHGFDDWTDEKGARHDGYRTVVLRDYHPRRVAPIAGVDVETVIEVARDFAKRQPGPAIGEADLPYGANDVYARLAIHSLNALAGNIGKAGGVLVQSPPPLALGPEVEPDAVAAPGLAKPRVDGAGTGIHLFADDAVQALPAALRSGSPYAVKAVLVHGTNPLHDHPDRDALREALSRVPFVAAVSSFVDETCAAADLVLPAAHTLESWQASAVTSEPGCSLFVVGRPAVPPRDGVRSAASAILNIAKSTGGATGAAFPWEDDVAVVRSLARGLFDARRGYVLASREKEAVRAVLQTQGLWEPEFADFDAFWEALAERGGWCDPGADIPDAGACFRTPSGRFELYSAPLRELLERDGADRTCQALGIQASGDLRCLPHWEPGPALAEDPHRPLLLTVEPLSTLGGLHGADAPVLQEYPSVRARTAHWGSWVELNPATAHGMGLRDGDAVVVESVRARVRTVLRLDPGVHPGTANFPAGGGHTAVGRWAKGRGANPWDLVAEGTDSLLGTGVMNRTHVKVYRG